MVAVFTAVLNMSLSACMIIPAVMLIRLFLKKAPVKYSYFLWMIVFIRLAFPFVPNVSFGVVPQVSISPQEVYRSDAGAARPENRDGLTVNTSPAASGESGPELSVGMTDTPVTAPHRSAGDGTPGMWRLLSLAWAGTGGLLLLFGMYSWFRYKKRYGTVLREVMHGKARPGEPAVVTSGLVKAPFTAGILHPVIYLPAGLSQGSEELILAHEKIHIRRRDYLVKPIAFLLLCVHWFNPLVWLSFCLMERDMEASCDEAVLEKTGYTRKKEYAGTLLLISENREFGIGFPTAFGSGDVRFRIKKALKSKKAKIWVTVPAVAVLCAAAVLLLVNGKEWSRPEAWLEPAALYADAAAPAVGEPLADMADSVQKLQPDVKKAQPVRQEPTEKATVYTAADVSQEDSFSAILRGGDVKNADWVPSYASPVAGARISSAFGVRTYPGTGKQISHSGIDFAAEIGTKVTAAEDGCVVETGRDEECGNYIILLHDNGELTYYTGCAEILAETGNVVGRGDEIATVGNSFARSTGAHLHFALSRDGSYVEPVLTGE